MSRCLLVYFSQGGSTRRIAGSIAKGLRDAQHSVDLHNLKDGPAPDFRGYDFLGAGTPAYYFRPPFIVTDYLNSLSELAGKPFFVFVVHGSYPGDTGNIVRRNLEQKGGKETGYSPSAKHIGCFPQPGFTPSILRFLESPARTGSVLH